mmetsp:Transcript_9816/g.14638  ORF Transcript_9816/g.14638 Transcript_9816/m.14638 type:complete len:312 (-) Transcript_9816:5-940(-)
MEKVQKNNQNNLSGEYYPCPDCKKYLTPEEFNTHLQNCIENEKNKHLDRKISQLEQDNRLSCTYCKRKFAPDRILKHQKACKLMTLKRPRIRSNDTFYYKDPKERSLKKKLVRVSPDNQNYSEKKWHKQHQDFLQKMRFGRKLEKLTLIGADTSMVKSPPNLDEEYIVCPHCQRSYSEKAAERHIPKCSSIVHKPKPIKRSEVFPKIEKGKCEMKTIKSTAQISSSQNCSLVIKEENDFRNLDTTINSGIFPNPDSTTQYDLRLKDHKRFFSTLSNYSKQPSNSLKNKLCAKCKSKCPILANYCMKCGFKQ